MSNFPYSILVCPRDKNNLVLEKNTLICSYGHNYPIINGVPILLVEEADPTIGFCSESLSQIISRSNRESNYVGNYNDYDGVDKFVQEWVSASCGNLYSGLVNNLPRYPIPEIRLNESSGESLLDIGCSWGRWSIAAARKGYITFGIDPSYDAICAARRVSKKLGVSIHFLVADTRYLPFPKNFFDVVFSYSVLQHFKKSNVSLSIIEISRVLKESGFCMIQMPNLIGLRNLYNQFKNTSKNTELFRIRYWSLLELKKLFEKYIGPVSFFVDGFFALGIQKNDIDLLPFKYKVVVAVSELLRRMSEKIGLLKYFADSVYVKSYKSY